MQSIIDRAHNQHNGLFRSMCAGGTWHLYRAPGTDNVAIMRDDAQWDVPVWPVMVPNVHAMTARQLASRVQTIVRA